MSQEISPSLDLLGHLLPPNPYLRSLKLDCRRLDDSAVDELARDSLEELALFNCYGLSGRLLFEIGRRCGALRCFLTLPIYPLCFDDFGFLI